MVKKIIVVSKDHVDLGFTESTAKVLHDDLRWKFGIVIDTNEQLYNCNDGPRRFVWTTPSYLAFEALERLKGQELKRIEKAFADGILAWHALPFTMHSEYLDPSLFEFGLTLSEKLDDRFGKKTIAAKATDVPGHTRGIVPILADHGVRFLEIGINGMCPMPAVPPLFRWQDAETNKEIVVAYHHSYSGPVQLPGSETRLEFFMVGDNMEIPSVADIRQYYYALCQSNPGAQIVWGTLSEYASTITEAQVKALPIFQSEIGDTWIHGVGSDHRKTGRFKELCRLRRDWMAKGRFADNEPMYVSFSKNLLCVAEHTWGVNSDFMLHEGPMRGNLDFRRERGPRMAQHL